MPAKTTKAAADIANPYGYSEMDWAAQLDPAYAAARAEVRRLSVGEDGTLSVKVKELIVLGILASRGLQYGVEAHMRRALDYGATREELFEAIKAAGSPWRWRGLQCRGPGAPGAGAGRRFPATAPVSCQARPAGHDHPAGLPASRLTCLNPFSTVSPQPHGLRGRHVTCCGARQRCPMTLYH